jgi:extracellular factor (EF) 3-hydroxypalmitic acid methyl ester biosynthesis protein
MAKDADVAVVVRTAGELLRERLNAAAMTADEGARQSLVKGALDDCLANLSRTGVWGEDNRLLSSQLWTIVGDLLETGWLQSRARHKPRGYAGDHELLRRIADRVVCEHPLGRCFDQYFQSQLAPQAVRNRIELAAGWITKAVERAIASVCHIASVGSGPAIDVALACRRLSPEQCSRLHVTLLDVDGEALDWAAARISPFFAPSQISIVQSNIFRLAERPALAAPLQGCDVILCTGLFDYLPEVTATLMLKEFWSRLAPGGAAFVFNFAPYNPTRAYMEWLGNWYLLYRSEAELAALATAAGIPADLWKISAEPLGIDLYIKLNKPAS